MSKDMAVKDQELEKEEETIEISKCGMKCPDCEEGHCYLPASIRHQTHRCICGADWKIGIV